MQSIKKKYSFYMFDAGVRQVTVERVATAVFIIRRAGCTERIAVCSVVDDDYVSAKRTDERVVTMAVVV